MFCVKMEQKVEERIYRSIFSLFFLSTLMKYAFNYTVRNIYNLMARKMKHCVKDIGSITHSQ